jgi:hypothetical protein
MTAAEVVITRCWWCKSARGPWIVVGCVETGSGPGWAIRACGTCVESLRLVPLEEHPDSSDGRPIYRPRIWEPS